MLKVPFNPFANPALLTREELQKNIQYCERLLKQHEQRAEKSKDQQFTIDMLKDAILH